MRFPEWLYRLLPGDTGTQQLGLIWREGTTTQAAATVSTTVYTVPNDKCLVLTNVAAKSSAGAAQNAIRSRIFADPPEGTVRYAITDNQADVNPVTRVDNWQGEVVIPGGWKVKYECVFSAGAAANQVDAEIFGFLIPRGTFVFG